MVTITCPDVEHDQTSSALSFQNKLSIDESPPMDPLSKVPIELLAHIVSFLEHEDAAKLRATNGTMRALVSEKTFEKIHVYYRDDDFAMVRYLSRDPVYSRCIKTLILHGDVLPTVPACKDYIERKIYADKEYNRDLREVGFRPSQFPPRPILSKEELRESHRRLSLHQHQQTQIFSNNSDYDFFMEVVPKLCNLQHVFVAIGNEFCPGRHGPSMLNTPACSYRNSWLWRTRSKGTRQVDSVLMALAISPTRERLRRLQLSAFSWDFINQLNNSPSKLDQVIDVCRSLTSFEISTRSALPDANAFQEYEFLTEDHIRDCREAVSKGSLRKILESMSHLRTLTVRFADLYYEIDRLFPDSQGIPAAMNAFLPAGYHWMHLEKVEFQTIECTSQQILDFLERHASTLKKAMFRNIRLIGTSWLVFLPQVRELMCRLPLSGLLGNTWFTGYLFGESTEASTPREYWHTDEDPFHYSPHEGPLAWRIIYYLNSESAILPLGPSNSLVKQFDLYDGSEGLGDEDDSDWMVETCDQWWMTHQSPVAADHDFYD
ncbi:hypothetical protein N0V93_004442 [Gnomoniopsis smithogilvyi]|uniref:F-box domain-containing protein n=1 Tax=Gnomoniopsis smithogilvyi TaxID=1191159 RepID=A0A9W9CW75_9PEZI|nr:hypothetical protein N0V93_004442 [Gnomoniopsis smithogilvyi]